MQIIKQTDEEKMAMYMKMPKKKLAEMLIQCNKALDMHYVESKISSNGMLSPSFLCALASEKRCDKQCWTCSEDQKCDEYYTKNWR